MTEDVVHPMEEVPDRVSISQGRSNDAPMIGKALDKYDQNIPVKETEHKKKLEVKDLQDIIESTL
ncbi:MAG: hypothetical protein R2741_11215 [Methanolobus sp.]